MAREARAIIVDTYAIMADLIGEASRRALEVLDAIRLGRLRGLLHYLIVYELAYHWRRGRLPFKDEEELVEFIDTYFELIDLDPETALKASHVKLLGDRMLREASEPRLKGRALSVADATTIALALRRGMPVLTGDPDLAYVAGKLGVEVIW